MCQRRQCVWTHSSSMRQGLVPHSLRIESWGTPRWSEGVGSLSWNAGSRLPSTSEPGNTAAPALTQVWPPPGQTCSPPAPAPGPFLLLCRLPGRLFLHLFTSVLELLPQKASARQTNLSNTLSPSLLYLFIFSELESVFLLCNDLFVLLFFCNVSSMRTDLVKLSAVPPGAGARGARLERGKFSGRNGYTLVPSSAFCPPWEHIFVELWTTPIYPQVSF